MAEYLVTWTVEVEADSARDAARQARAIQLDPASTATIFRVEHDSPDDEIFIDVAET